MIFFSNKSCFLPLFLNVLFFPLILMAEPVSLKYDNLKLNAELLDSDNNSQAFFLILHGTFAWQGMELPVALQTLLKEEGYGSLAITLSLGLNDRHGFFDCSLPIVSRHDDAQKEIDQWLNFLNKKGYSNIVLVGHSRGGAQIASYAVVNPDKVKQVFLIAPMVWIQSEVNKQYRLKNSVKMEELKHDGWLVQQNVLYCNKATISAEAFASYYGKQPDKNTPTIIQQIKIPTRIYLGSEDPLTKKLLKQQAVYADNPYITHYTIDGADHFFRDLYLDDIVDDMIGQLW